MQQSTGLCSRFGSAELQVDPCQCDESVRLDIMDVEYGSGLIQPETYGSDRE